jgi:two-component system, OmpR family, sensor histidine kinase MprB
VSFRVRVILLGALATAIAVASASAVAYFVVRDQLIGEVDDALRARAADIAHEPAQRWLFAPPEHFGGPSGYVQLVRGSDRACTAQGETSCLLPVTSQALAAATKGKGPYYGDLEVEDTHLRVLTFQVAPNYAVQLARPLDEVDHSLERIRRWLFLIGAIGIAVAAALGLAVSRAALAPVRRLTRTAEHVSETQDLSERIEVHGHDELSRLASTFNTMLAALEESARAQRQLVSDASHELRTPLTSLRTNIEVLTRDDAMDPVEREQLLRDVGEQLVEMSELVSELVELARGDRQPEEQEDVRLDLVTAEAIERTRRNRPGASFNAHLEQTLVRGVSANIERAVSNLLDNAAKWSPPGAEIDVFVREGEVVVRDRGPGIADEDAPFVFDRFYRAPSARSLPGSGLGLAIVRQVAEAHGGTVTVEAPEGGGTRMRLRLPVDGNGKS